MTEKYPILYNTLRGLGLFLLIGMYVIPNWMNQSFFLLGLLAILFLGIPHGATDYLIFKNLKQSFLGSKKLLHFYIGYLAIMALYSLVWISLPSLGLLIFIGLSLFHFGQSNWVYIFPVNNVLSWLTYLIWGMFVLVIPIMAHYETALPVVAAIAPNLAFDISESWRTGIIIAVSLITLFTVLSLFLYGILNRRNLFNELLNLLILGTALYLLPLWLGFAFYFAGWHSLTSIQEQIAFFQSKNPNYNWKDYIKNTTALSIVSLLGITGLIYWGGTFESVVILKYLFIFIGVVTLPHMLLIHQLYKD
jgi:Brp/Blh family beta-carotene 15,15'-monooxygenase